MDRYVLIELPRSGGCRRSTARLAVALQGEFSAFRESEETLITRFVSLRVQCVPFGLNRFFPLGWRRQSQV